MNFAKQYFGYAVIFTGLVLLLNQMGVPMKMDMAWPVFLLVPGLFFWFLYNENKEKKAISGVLIPGTILVFYGLYFFFNNFTQYRYVSQTSFLFVFGVALSFYAAYYFSKNKPKGLLFVFWILTAVSAVVFLGVNAEKWWPLALVAAGVLLLVRKDGVKKENANG